MYKRFTLSVLFIFALFLGLNFTNSVSADKKGKNDKNLEASRALASTTLVISQAYGGGGGATGTYNVDYVELKNISASPQSLNGLSLYYGSATGQFASMATNAFALPNVTLQPGQYYLVQTSTAGMGPPGLPVTPDATTTNLSMSGTNGKVALVNGLAQNTCGAVATPCTLPNAQIIDLVAWGTSNNAEGGAATNGGGSLTATQGNVRKLNGCQDTDNNNADFDIPTAPTPRNTSTPLAPCNAAPTDAANDLNGDGKSDYTVVRNVGGGAGGQIRWFYNTAGTADPTVALDWGISGDFFLMEDYDGDGKDDITVYRAGAAGTAAFYILQSQTMTARIDTFGQNLDDPTVAGDYDGDGKADPAVYRAGATSGAPSVWYYRGSLTPANVTVIPWGQNGDFPAPGDYDGDGKNDFVIQRNNGGGQAGFWTRLATGAILPVKVFGTPTDNIVPGDYDGDGKTDLAVARGIGGNWNWFWLRSSDGQLVGYIPFGASATDFFTQGDYNGDGKTDIGIWRPSASPNGSFYVYRDTASGAVSYFTIGQNGDYPVNNWNRH